MGYVVTYIRTNLHECYGRNTIKLSISCLILHNTIAFFLYYTVYVPIKENQKISLLICGSFFWIWTQTFIRVSNLRLTSCINFGFFSTIASILFFSQQLLIVNLVFYKVQLSNPKFWTFSQLFFLGFKTQVFNFQFLTRPDISFSRFPNDYFWSTLISPLSNSILYPLAVLTQ